MCPERPERKIPPGPLPDWLVDPEARKRLEKVREEALKEKSKEQENEKNNGYQD